MTVDIIGAGLGGLTTAIALEEKKINVNVYEQAKEIRPFGAGIILANNAMQVYEKLGLRKEIEVNGNPISSINITKPNLKPISKVDLNYFERKHGVKNIAIHRGRLQQILAHKINPEKLHLDHQLRSVQMRGNTYSLKFNKNRFIKSAILLGADGLNSVVRQNLFVNNQVRNANQICWRGVTNFQLPIKYQSELNEAWGKGDRFGFVQIASNMIYWYALRSFKSDKEEFLVNDIENYFEKYHSVIRDIISATPKDKINTTEISDLQPTKIWYKKNVCLIGDAAHATTPNMGQGACQAIEDAYTIAECLQKYEVNDAFAKYQKLRLPKAHHIVKISWTLGKLAHLSNPVSIGLRNQIMKLTPNFVNRKLSKKIFQLATV